MSTETRPPLRPFSQESARLKVRLAEDAWNTRDPERVALAYVRTRTRRADNGEYNPVCAENPTGASKNIVVFQ